MTIEESELISWVQQSTGIDNFVMSIIGTTEAGAGYMGEFYFLNVRCIKTQKQHDIAIKIGKRGVEVRKKFPLYREACKRELTFYDRVIPTFRDFQNEKNLQEPFDAVPHCYKTFFFENFEVVVLKNMKTEGYELHPKETSINGHHVRLVLKNYAKFHAISFAMQDQKKDVFDKIISEHYAPFLKEAYTTFEPLAETNAPKILNNLRQIGRDDLCAEFRKFVETGYFKHVADVLGNPPDTKAIVHADCHNSNFLYKYQDATKDIPSNMVMLDFQASSFHSPMLDLSYFFYVGLSKDGFSELDEHLEFYYKEFSLFLIQLGSDPNKLFPKSLMLQHWKRCSVFGFFITCTFMELIFIPKNESPTLNQITKGEFYKSYENVEESSKKRYLERLEAVVEHFFSFNSFSG